MKKTSGFIGSAIFAFILIIGVILGAMCSERIPAGYVGVVYNLNGGIEETTLGQGFHFIAPTKKVTLYSIGIEQSYLTSEDKGDSRKDESFNIPTSDGKTVRVDLEFSYKFDAERLAETFTRFKGRSGEEIKDTFIKPKIVAWTQEVSAKYPVTDIFGDKRTQINSELDEYLKAKFEPYGIVIDTVNFTNISVDDETAAAIQKKVTAQQELELASIEAETARINAEKDKEVAMIAAERDKAVAEVEAEKIRIAAQAEAEANRVVSASLTPELIEQQKLDKWNGTLPQIVSDSTIIKDFVS
jgi:regulator of protease activity HflC (stomatin/prohibitin superfamily)